MTLNQAQALAIGDKVKITVLKFLPYMVGRVVYKVVDGRTMVRYFSTTGASCAELFYPDELDFG